MKDEEFNVSRCKFQLNHHDLEQLHLDEEKQSVDVTTTPYPILAEYGISYLKTYYMKINGFMSKVVRRWLE
jgi:hypothetical protein